MKNTDTWKGPKKTPFYCGLVLSGTRFTETKTEKIAEKLGEAANDGINYNSITAWSIIKIGNIEKAIPIYDFNII